jgi:class 3 adenylate cyclase
MPNELSGSKAADPYACHFWRLAFVDTALEARYCRHRYVDGMYVVGKLMVLILILVCLMGYFVFQHGGPFVSPSAYIFTDAWWVTWHIAFVTDVAMFCLMFVDSLKEWREMMYIVAMLPFMPAWIIVALAVKEPVGYTYGYIFAVEIFTLLGEVRLVRLVPLLTIVPTATLFIVTFAAMPGYFDDDNHLIAEVLYWPYFGVVVYLSMMTERRSRRTFVEREKANLAIAAAEHKKQVTEKMIARFFPATPTTDMLRVVGGPRSKTYRGAVMIVTDIVGFTAYTSRTDPQAVIAMLTDLFHAIDVVAPNHCVEKVSTVGDSYCGTIFPQGLHGWMEEPDKGVLALRCSHGVEFGCSILHFADGNRMRIGVHVGDVIGGFVGCSPPKFDLFGADIDHAKHMEESGTAAMVHVSTAILNAVGTAAVPVNSTPTNDGIVCDGWAVSSGPLSAPLELLAAKRAAECESDAALESHAAVVVAAVVAFAHRDMIDVSLEVGQERSADGESAEEIGGVSLAFHLVLLEFGDDATERRFGHSLRASNVNDEAAKAFFLLFLMQQSTSIGLGCFEMFQDRAMYTVIGVLGTNMYMFMHVLDTNHRFFGAATFIVYNAMACVAFLGLRGDCDGPRRLEYTGGIAYLYLLLAMVAPQFIFDVKLKWRVAQLLSTGVLGVILTIIRRNLMQDELMIVDVMIFLPCVGYFALSYFTEYALRDTFVAVTKVERLLASAKGRNARMAATAMDVMMPPFVTERVVEAAKAKRPTGNKVRRDSMTDFSGTGIDTSSVSEGSSADVDIDFDDISALWEFPHVVVLFAAIRADSLRYDTVDNVIQEMEQTVARHGVLKVKTMGSTMMCLIGIDSSRSRTEAVATMIDAARDMRRVVLQPLAAHIDGLHYAIGINCGPCFGAVIGGNGAIFDIFGDTVNTASRMMSTAANGAIQISTAMNRSLPTDPRRLRCHVQPLPSVHVKGKGILDVFAVVELMRSRRQSLGDTVLEQSDNSAEDSTKLLSAVPLYDVGL